MTFAPLDADAMLTDFGSVVEFGGARVTGILDHTMISADDGNGFAVQRKVQVLKIRAGALGVWARDDAVLIDGARWRLRERLDDPRTLDEAYDMISVGRA
jgi:hypothetical protein